ncbi:MAG: hypothetical protein IKO27_05055 [Ruminococcus sp.]|nr:hypothetical protein [Ruminococcus sp.]
MKDILSNVWVKRCVSVFTSAYFAVIVLLTYATFLYKLEFAEGMTGPFLVLYGSASVVFLALMIFSREIFLTRLISVLMMPVTFCLILLNMYNWALIVPPFVVAIVIFFAAGTKEHVKVILGTIYLLMYVLGIVAYFVLNMLLGGSSVETVIDLSLDPASSVYQIYSGQMKKISEVTDDANTYSPNGDYRFYITDLQDSDKGAVHIYVVPANQDIELKYFTLKQKGIKKTIEKNGTRGIVPSAGWIIEQDETTGENFLAVLYQLSDEEAPKVTRIRGLPDKNYFEFLGVS